MEEIKLEEIELQEITLDAAEPIEVLGDALAGDAVEEYAKASESPLPQDVFRDNEIAANIMIGKIFFYFAIVGVAMWIASFLPVQFVLSAKALRVCGSAALLTFVVSVIIKRHKGEGKWIKYLAIWGMLVLCSPIVAVSGAACILVMATPLILSVRYYDKRFTMRLLIGTVAAIAIAYVIRICALGSGENILLVSLFSGTMIVLGICCWHLADSGRQIVVRQAKITEVAAKTQTELDLATSIQSGMLPKTFPAFPEFPQLDLYAENRPAKCVGGDFYDYFKIDDDHIGMVMADVSGKGISAALFMSISKIVVKNMILHADDLGVAMTDANSQLCENNDAGMFVTCWAGVYEISTGKLSFANAGHNAPVIIKKDARAEYLSMKKNFILAVMDGFKYTEESIQLGAGDEIYLYTDGVTEANNEKEEMYGDERLLEFIDTVKSEPAQAQVEKINAELAAFAGSADQFDDITMLCLKVK